MREKFQMAVDVCDLGLFSHGRDHGFRLNQRYTLKFAAHRTESRNHASQARRNDLLRGLLQ